jgi:hypothetical protein
MARTGVEVKPAWRSLPIAVRTRVEEVMGAAVARGLRVWGGYAPSVTFRLILDDTRGVFFKGANQTSTEVMHQLLDDEERVYRELGSLLTPWAPTFYGSFRVSGWHVVLLEDLGPPSVPPRTRRSVSQAMVSYAAFHRHNLGQSLPDWLPRRTHHRFALMWAGLQAEPGGLLGVASLAGARASDASGWLTSAVPRLNATAEALAHDGPPQTLLHFDTRSDNLRLQPGGCLRLFDWPYACVGPPEIDLAGFAQSIKVEGGPAPEDAVAPYARDLPVRDEMMDSAVAAVAGYFAQHAWREPIPGLPRLRPFQRAQLKVSLAWAARRLHLSTPDWLDAVPGQ